MPDVIVPGPTDAATPSSGGPAFRRILLAVGNIADDPRASSAAWSQVARSGGAIAVCHVVMRSTSSASNEADGSPANAEETSIVAALRARAVAAMPERGRDVPIEILHGDPGQRICEFARFWDADLIVLGPRERPPGALSMRGSVSKYVLQHSGRNVLVLQR